MSSMEEIWKRSEKDSQEIKDWCLHVPKEFNSKFSNFYFNFLQQQIILQIVSQKKLQRQTRRNMQMIFLALHDDAQCHGQ